MFTRVQKQRRIKSNPTSRFHYGALQLLQYCSNFITIAITIIALSFENCAFSALYDILP